MSLSLLFRKAVLCCLAGALPLLSFAREGFPKSGAEYCVPGPLPGLQTLSRVSISAAGGFVVWEDNVADGKGLGIRAQALSSDLTKIGPPFRVNQIAPGD